MLAVSNSAWCFQFAGALLLCRSSCLMLTYREMRSALRVKLQGSPDMFHRELQKVMKSSELLQRQQNGVWEWEQCLNFPCGKLIKPSKEAFTSGHSGSCRHLSAVQLRQCRSRWACVICKWLRSRVLSPTCFLMSQVTWNLKCVSFALFSSGQELPFLFEVLCV